ncbi:type I-F CRISPR-associated protein Csy2 [Thioalbus denitrificans]|uniref:CRISPR-associated Csy2 family protein n=1 Tax=Thioalbus denitrificans TaxID=547122 RepID=A0A369BT99_9GAMM|nr:type I-F CRISPR-associated protein Csy2 [Thioalbus denitrificans]RCX24880.1 CRISPR-associated Csy2 family protein [Thioalbus denitrificans]
MTEPTALLLLPRLRVQNANAISGPLSWGFPSPTAFTGFVHALERQFTSVLEKGFAGVGIVCHDFEPQISQPAGKRTQVFRLTRNPVGKDGSTQALVEEGRTHMEVSLVIAVRDYLPARKGREFADDAMTVVHGMRIAGGSILPKREGRRFDAQWWPLEEDLEGQRLLLRKFRRRLLPGFALVERPDRLAERLSELRERQPDACALDALLDLTRLNFDPDMPDPEKPGELRWGIRRKPGWLVPIPVGYAALSPLYAAEEVANSRDDSTPFRFVESLYSLGEWVSPHRLTDLNQLLWYSEADSAKGIYRCINRYSQAMETATTGIA